MKVLVGVAIAVVILAVPVLMYFSYSNSEITLRNQVEGQQKSNAVTFDTVWKIISGQAQVAEQHKDAFEKIYVSIMEKRYEGKDPLLSFITEANPNFDMKLYEKVSNSIEAQRETFKRDQKKLIDLAQEHKTLCQTAPGSFFLSGRPMVEIKLVTSSRTEKAFETGKEDETDVFQKKK